MAFATLCVASLGWVAEAAAAAVSPANAATGALLASLDAAGDEERGRELIKPHLVNLKQLDAKVVGKVVARQWWALAREIVAESHAQKVDLSFTIRNAVRTLKDEADELLRTLNPKYAVAQQVSPAFQWAQNDTSIFLTIKFTVRWNAPGALEVTQPSVNFTEGSFNFTGLGKHSNNKYKYLLSMNLFDALIPAQCTWSAASVGKLSVTLRKRWPRKWPRLLVDKTTKIGNMHHWSEMQEKSDSSLSGMSTVANSPRTCGLTDKLYCLATDTCKKSANCTQCPGKNIPNLEDHVCTGMPGERASISFKDADMDANEIGGTVKITKARNEFDIDQYAVYFGKDEREKLLEAAGTDGEIDVNPNAMLVGEVAPTGSDTEIKLKQNSAIPEGATHLLVFSKNKYGEYATPGAVLLKDAILPKDKAAGLLFEDEDGERGEVSGTLTILRATQESLIEKYAVHWGRSMTRKIATSSYVRDIEKREGKDPTHYISRNTKIPEGASHLLVFSKNDDGEMSTGVGFKFVDNTKPCINKTDADCPTSVSVSPTLPSKVTIEPAKQESQLTHYTVYWGRRDCSEGGQTGAKNGHLIDLPVADAAAVSTEIGAETAVPAGTTHILAFTKNKYGESDHCVAVEYSKGDEPKSEL